MNLISVEMVATALLAMGAGVGIKIAYDFLRYKAPPRDTPDQIKFPEKYDADLCAFKHNQITRDFSYLEEEDKKINLCVSHVKSKIQGLEILAAEHEQKLVASEKRISVLETFIDKLDAKTTDTNRGVSELLSILKNRS